VKRKHIDHRNMFGYKKREVKYYRNQEEKGRRSPVDLLDA
jgi:hypothetical protein